MAGQERIYHIIRISSRLADVHGIMLRKDIMKFVNQEMDNGLKIAGIVENVPENTVELRFRCENGEPEDVLEIIKQAVKKNGILDNEEKQSMEIKLAGEVKSKVEPFSWEGIHLKRSSDLQEIAWALQGAGNLFKISAEGQQKSIDLQVKTIREMRKIISVRDLKKELRSLKVLKQEFAYLYDAILAGDERKLSDFDIEWMDSLQFLAIEKLDEEKLRMLRDFKDLFSSIIDELYSDSDERRQNAKQRLTKLREDETVKKLIDDHIAPLIEMYKQEITDMERE